MHKIEKKTEIRKAVLKADGYRIMRDVPVDLIGNSWTCGDILNYIREFCPFGTQTKADLNCGLTWFFKDFESAPEAHQ